MTIVFTAVSANASTLIPKGIDIGPVRFDAILELNAPNAGSHVVLFVRYWVTPEHYSASVIWAEPHASGLNYATYPVTTSFSSDSKHFNLRNHIYKFYDSKFTKPVEDKHVFSYTNNNYDIRDIRYAESGAEKSRIYLSDIPQSENKEESWQTFKLQRSKNKVNLKRSVREISTHEKSGRINAVKLFSSDGRLLKDIEYGYSKGADKFEISSIETLLPECPILVGPPKGRKAKVYRENGGEQEYTSWYAKHHIGGRRCVIQFEDERINDTTARLPKNITVYNDKKGSLLRSARLFNFVSIKGNYPEFNTVKTLADYDNDELELRKILIKCWMQSPEQVSTEDSNSMQRLYEKFNHKVVENSSAGRELRRIYMLMILDLMQGNEESLSEHFQDYLECLVSNDLKYMTLVGGQRMIDITSRWKQYSAADKLLNNWLYIVTKACKTETMLRFCQSAALDHRFWMVASLINQIELDEVSVESHLKARILQAESLYALLKIVKQNDLATTNHERAQIGWVKSSYRVNDVINLFHIAVYDAEQQYVKLGDLKDNKEMRALTEKLKDLQKRAKKVRLPK